MARNRKTKRRRRRGRFALVLRFVCALLIAGAIVAAMTLFFRVQTITVSGNERYETEEIIDASGIRIEDNLFLLNKYTAAQTIFDMLPYVEEASIRRRLPDEIVITVRECDAAAGIETGDGFWLISENGKFLEKTEDLIEGCPTVTGIEAGNATLSAQLSGDEGQSGTVETLLTILQTARDQGMLAGIGSIDLSDPTAIHMEYLGRFTVKMPWDAEIPYAFLGIQSVVNGTESNETGEINLMTLMSHGKVHFIPKSG